MTQDEPNVTETVTLANADNTDNDSERRHDPLCPSLLEKGLPDKFGMMERASCRCDLIARVREDERAAALRDATEAVKALHDDKTSNRTVSGKREPDEDYRWALYDSIAAIEALGGER